MVLQHWPQAGVQFGPGGAGFVLPLYGNPGDYAWGTGGLDAVVTNLLNQVSIKENTSEENIFFVFGAAVCPHGQGILKKEVSLYH
jgi:hypothetical protein